MHSASERAELPLRLRACRALLVTQAAYTLFGGLFVLLTAVLLGGSYSIPLRDSTVSGGAAAVLGCVYVAVAATLAWVGVAVGRRAVRTTPAVAAAEILVVALQVFRGLDLSLPSVITIGLAVATMTLLLTP